MAIDKIYENFTQTVTDVPDGASMMLGNFAGPGGTPYFLINALVDKEAFGPLDLDIG